MTDSEFMTVAEARVRLGVSKDRMAALIRKGTLTTEDNPFDARSKLIKRADVETLLATARPARAPKSRAA